MAAVGPVVAASAFDDILAADQRSEQLQPEHVKGIEIAAVVIVAVVIVVAVVETDDFALEQDCARAVAGNDVVAVLAHDLIVAVAGENDVAVDAGFDDVVGTGETQRLGGHFEHGFLEHANFAFVADDTVGIEVALLDHVVLVGTADDLHAGNRRQVVTLAVVVIVAVAVAAAVDT